VQDLDREVLAALTEDLLLLLSEHLAGAMMGIYDVVPHLELDERSRLGGLEILFQVLFR
jgi:hypothetical protein